MDNAARNSCSQIMLLFVVVLTVLAHSFFLPSRLEAKPVSPQDAEKVVRGWLRRNPRPMEAQLGSRIRKTDVFVDDAGQTIYYVVYLDPSGFVVVPADDYVEPIIAFVEKGAYDPAPDNPLGALVSRDLAGRMAAVRSLGGFIEDSMVAGAASQESASPPGVGSESQAKWALLQSYDGAVGIMGLTSISDVRVAPLVQSAWGQGDLMVYTDHGREFWPLYNYYVPGNEVISHYGAGCVAAAMAQLMKYHEHPSVGVGTASFTFLVDGEYRTEPLMGGDGAGGPYHWTEMVLEPDASITETQRQAIGALYFDAGISVGTHYTQFGSSTAMFLVPEALVDTFKYGNAVVGGDYSDFIGAGMIDMINPNLDCNHPVILAINSDSAPGHAVVCDGYGYDMSTLYHHLNMGWSAKDDAWYALPVVGSNPAYDIIESCVYNIFTSGSGEIISGQVVGPGDTPISSTVVTAHICGGETFYAASNSKGIYALARIPSGTPYYVTASKNGWRFEGREVTTGTSNNDATFSGNVWGIDFSGSASSGFVELEKRMYIVPEVISVRVVDSDLVGKGSQTVLLEVCGGDVEAVTLSEDPANSGIHTGDIPTAGGVAVKGDGTLQISGTGRIITVYEDQRGEVGTPVTLYATATVADGTTIVYQTDFADGLPSGWSIVDGYRDGNTWNSENPGNRTSKHWNGTFMIVDCRNPSTYEMDEQLVSHSIDCSPYERIILSFSHYFCSWPIGKAEIGEVNVRVDAGPWQTVARYQGADAEGVVGIDISQIAARQPDVQLRWRYYNTNRDWYWGIDNVSITGVMPPVGAACDLAPDCEIDFKDFAALATKWPEGNCGSCEGFDLTGDGGVGADDLQLVADHWLTRIE